VYYRDLTSCRANGIPLGNSRTMKGALYHDAKAGKLPKVSLVIPDTINSGHDTTLSDYDALPFPNPYVPSQHSRLPIRRPRDHR
jgi:hypothetical protein